MGQRHQLFVIARIGSKYRSLAVVHHQWLYGHTALRRCRDILDLFTNPINHIALRTELAIAESKSEEFWSWSDEQGEKDGRSYVEFPFITTCLMVGVSFSSRDGYIHLISVEPFRMAYDEGSNNNGQYDYDVETFGGYTFLI